MMKIHTNREVQLAVHPREEVVMNKDVHATPAHVPFDSSDRHLGVLVGFDGSSSSTAALHYGARAARRRNTALTVVSAYSVSPPSTRRLLPCRRTRRPKQTTKLLNDSWTRRVSTCATIQVRSHSGRSRETPRAFWWACRHQLSWLLSALEAEGVSRSNLRLRRCSTARTCTMPDSGSSSALLDRRTIR